ncbi:MAG TPA: hypothetical protein VK447_06625, partial [Myxococcaceae bacterium]|nr:hypothetical protein [Myxococcaceae bacterium]
GSSHNDGAGRNAGAVYIFRKGDGQWRQLTKLHRLAAHEGDEYGRSVALSNAGFVAAGAWMTGAHAPEAGAVEVTSHPGTICADDCPILRCGREHEVEDPAQRVPSTAKPRPPTWCELD